MLIEDPPFFEHLLLEQPLPLVVVLIVAAVLVLFVNRGSLTRKAMLAAGALLVAGVGVYVVARVVETDRESLIAAARDLARRAQAGSIDKLRDDFDEYAMLTGPDGDQVIAAGALLDALERIHESRKLGTHTITKARSQLKGKTTGQTYLRVRTIVGADQNAPHGTEWLFEWRRDKTGRWKVREMRWLKWRGQPPPLELIK